MFSRVHVGRRGVVVATLAGTGCGVRGRCGTAVGTTQRRFVKQGTYSVLPPPPMPPPPPAMYQSPQQHHSPRDPVVITVKSTRGDVAAKVIVTGLMFATIWVALLMLYKASEGDGLNKHRKTIVPEEIETKHFEHLLGTALQSHLLTKTGRGVVRFTTTSPGVYRTNLETFTTTFSEVLGCDEAKEELEEIVMFLKDPESFTCLGGKLPKGALLVGPPGTGKTMLAKAIAKEAGVPFFYMSGAEFDEMFVGVGSRRVRDLFEAAKQHAPSLIFIDELDAIGGKRSARDQSYQRMTLNQLLAEMDGFLSSDQVIVLGATNTPKTLDSALTRPGRLDRIINVDPPDVRGREAILQLYLSRVKRAVDINAMSIARGLPGYCGADLQNIVNTAAIHAAMQEKDEVDTDDLEFAKDRISMGAENRSRVIPDHERKVTAWHEAGHALAAIRSIGADPVHKATIVPRGSGVLGLVLQHPNEDKYSVSRQNMLARLVVALAGRAGEEELLGHSDITSGAASDFETATSLARVMVRKYGMAEEELGVVDYSSTKEHSGAYLSDQTKEKIEEATRALLDSAYSEALTMVRTHRKELEAIAEGLLEHETLNAEQLTTLAAGGTIPPPVALKKKTKEETPEEKPQVKRDVIIPAPSA